MAWLNRIWRIKLLQKRLLINGGLCSRPTRDYFPIETAPGAVTATKGFL